jgi:hypothetical protein
MAPDRIPTKTSAILGSGAECGEDPASDCGSRELDHREEDAPSLPLERLLSCEAVWAGSSLFVHAPRSGTILRLDRLGAFVWTMLSSGVSVQATYGEVEASLSCSSREARRAVQSQIRQWTEAGLFLDRPAPEAMPTFPEDIHWIFDRPVSCGGPALRLRTDNAELAALLAAVLPDDDVPHRLDDPPLSVVGRTLDIATVPEGFLIRAPDGRIGLSTTLSFARHDALIALAEASGPLRAITAIIHGSAVVHGRRAMVLAGVSGAGKSTLTAALRSLGRRLVADDIVPIERNDLTVRAVPFRQSLKSGSWDVLSDIWPDLSRAPVVNLRGLRIRYPELAEPAAAGSTWPVSVIVFPRYEARAPVASEPVSPEVCLSQLIESGTGLVGHPPNLQRLADLVNKTPAMTLSYGSALDAARYLVARHSA